MIDLYFSDTPNGLKLKLCLEELALPYRVLPVALSKGEQYQPAFLQISPNNKIPALVDHAPPDGGPAITLFESGAMLWYLAERAGRLLPTALRSRLLVKQWVFWQVAGLGPMAGQAGHFLRYAPEPVPYAIERYTRETARLYGVLDRQLAGREFIAGDFSIADIACYPWIVPHQGHRQDIAAFPHLQRWFASIAARPATRKAYQGSVDSYAGAAPPLSESARLQLFGGRI